MSPALELKWYAVLVESLPKKSPSAGVVPEDAIALA
jgi:hypothetical protein